MKKCKIMAAFLLASVCALPVMGQSVMKTQKIPSVMDSSNVKFFVPLPDEAEMFRQALLKGDVVTVKKIVKDFPHANLLKNPVKDEKGTKVVPVCMAAERGYNDLIKFMAKQDASLLKTACSESNKNVLSIALENHRADTAVVLLGLGVKNTGVSTPVFVKTAKSFTDTSSLNKLVPSLLKAGVNYQDVDILSYSSVDYDAFYTAATDKNENFVRILRDELVKRGTTPVSRGITWSCPGYSSADKKRWIRFAEESEAGQLLKKYDIALEWEVKETMVGCE